MPKRAWPGWADAIDEELAKAEGVLPWKRLRDVVVARFRSARPKTSVEDESIHGELALANIPTSYLSRGDELVRLPPGKVHSSSSNQITASCLVNSISWSGWLPACQDELGRAGGALTWKQLQKLLVARYCEAHRLSDKAVDKQALQCYALTQLPEEYLNREDEFVRLPSALSAEQPASKGMICEGGVCRRLLSAKMTNETAAAQSDVSMNKAASAVSRHCLRIIVCGDDQSFAEQLHGAAGKLVVVDFTAPWCEACQRIRPDLHELAAEMPEVVFLEVDVDKNSAVADHFRVKAMPTFLFFRDAVCVGSYEDADVDELALELIGHM